MQQNGRKKVSGAAIRKVEPLASATAVPSDRTGLPPVRHDSSGSPPSPHESSLPLSQAGTQLPAAGKGKISLSSDERQALAGGFFVMLSLAIALSVGWWMTPPSPASYLAEPHSRATPDSRPAIILPPVVEEEYGASHGGSDMKATASAVEPAEQSSPAPTMSDSDLSFPQTDGDATADFDQPSPSAATVTENKAATPASKRAEEVERLKAQAYSETRKERLGNSSAKPASSSGSTDRAPSSTRERRAQAKAVDLSQALEACNKEEGLFFRERCKWRLCNGSWGKNGCPSFQNDASAAWRVYSFWRVLKV